MAKILSEKQRREELWPIDKSDIKKDLQCVVQRRGIHFDAIRADHDNWHRVQILLVDRDVVHAEHLDTGSKSKYDFEKTTFFHAPREIFCDDYPALAIR